MRRAAPQGHPSEALAQQLTAAADTVSLFGAAGLLAARPGGRVTGTVCAPAGQSGLLVREAERCEAGLLDPLQACPRSGCLLGADAWTFRGRLHLAHV